MSNFESKVSTVAPWIGLQNFLKIFSFFTESSVRSTLSFHSHLLTNEKSQSKSTRTISEAVSLYHFFFKHNMLHLDARAVKRFLGCVAFSKWAFFGAFYMRTNRWYHLTYEIETLTMQGLNRNLTVKSEKAIFRFATRHSLLAMVPKKREVVWRNLWATVIMIRLDLDITSDRGYWTCIFSKFDEFVSNPSNHLLSGYNFKFNTTHQSIFWRSANFTSYFSSFCNIGWNRNLVLLNLFNAKALKMKVVKIRSLPYTLDSNRPSSYYTWFWLFVEVLFEIPGQAR